METTDFIRNLGSAALLTAFLVSIYTITAASAARTLDRRSWLESARLGVLLQVPLLSTALLALLLLILQNQFSTAYVYSVSSIDLPFYLKLSALWAGQEGSLLFWAWCMAAFLAAAVRRLNFDRQFRSAFILVTTVILAFFLMVVVFFENPFARLWQLVDGRTAAALIQPRFSLSVNPVNGQGMNPLLRHPGMIIHPPFQYLGFVAFVIPFGLAAAALITNQTGNEWTAASRKWSLAAWLFLTLGLVLGARWAYDVLGWGGYWGWDPVETAALLPWLSGTAFLHSIHVQEKRSMFRRWNFVLITLTFLLILFGTFVSRSGTFSSVHAFASSAVGILFFTFIAISLVTAILLLYWRWDTLGGVNGIESLLSREAAFLLNNILFTGLVLVCFWGLLFPLVSETFSGQRIIMGPEYYERATGPLWGLVLLLMGIAPATVFIRSSLKRLQRRFLLPAAGLLLTLAGLLTAGVRSIGALAGFPILAFTALVTLAEFWRILHTRMHDGTPPLKTFLHAVTANRRRYGGYLIHLGIVLMGAGILGIELFQAEAQRTLAPGESLALGRYSVRFEGMSFSTAADGVQQALAEVTVFADGMAVSRSLPRHDFYPDWQQSVTVPAVRSTLQDDLYIRLVAWGETPEAGATIKLYLNPLFNLLWIGTGVLIFGTLTALGPLAGSASYRATQKIRPDILS